ncbi:type VI secretion system Vgr family protein, partial [Exercitatus varius]|uniref:type VI secretion system Vgr family protein n=1 Tax=Exercitatus varius TaxID=67857 RepID=UPI00294B3BA2
GPAGEEIYCDEWGRVKIQFPWDRLGQEDENSSCWVRVSQAWAGAQFGNIAIPRIGHEVIVDFLEGDPDQPIITGRTYHSTTEPPYDLPAHKTRMSIKSKTHKGSGFNELRFEDEKEREEIFIHAERDQNNVVNHDETTQIGNDRSEQVGHDETIHIGHNRTETVGQDETLTVGQDQTNHIQRNRTTKIEKDEILNVGNCFNLDVYADQKVHNGGNHEHKIGRNSLNKAGQKLKHYSKNIQATGTTEVKILGKAGTIVIDGSGITLKGKVTIKGDLKIIGGSPESPRVFSFVANNAKPVCEVCQAMQNKKAGQ